MLKNIHFIDILCYMELHVRRLRFWKIQNYRSYDQSVELFESDGKPTIKHTVFLCVSHNIVEGYWNCSLSYDYMQNMGPSRRLYERAK